MRPQTVRVPALFAIAWLVCASPAWANIDLTGGRAVPGNAPRTLSFEDQAFADAASLIVPCGPFSCGTQFTRIPVTSMEFR